MIRSGVYVGPDRKSSIAKKGGRTEKLAMRSDLLVEVRRDSLESFIRKESHTMNFDRASWIVRGARPFLAALAILSVLGLATPSASASVSLSFSATDVNTSGTTSGSLTTGVASTFTLGSFGTTQVPVTITATALDQSNLSQLTTTNITLNNTSSTTDTINIFVTGVGFSLAGTASNGEAVLANFTISGTGGPALMGTDATTGSSWAGLTNTAFGTDTPFGSATIAPTSTSNLSANYSSGGSPTWGFNLAGSTFSLTQELSITLGAGDKANLTITTSLAPGVGGQSIPTPEPSSFAIAGLGALGMIGYGLRRRKAQGA